jgi:hypothetical protein
MTAEPPTRIIPEDERERLRVASIRPAAVVSAGSALTPGTLIPGTGLRLDKPLTSGGMGFVWTVTDTLNQYPGFASTGLVVKFVDPHLVTTHGRQILDQFLTEAATLQTLKYDGFLPMLLYMDLRNEPGWPPGGYLMPRHPRTLADVLDGLRKARQKLSREGALNLFRSLLTALNRLHHTDKLVHRDIKPSNLFVELQHNDRWFDPNEPGGLESARIIVGDFGLVTRSGFDPAFAVSQDRGGFGYKPPELFDHSGKALVLPADPAVDIFAAGRVLQNLLELCDAPPAELQRIAGECTAARPLDRPRAGFELLNRLRPDWDIQPLLITAGWQPDKHLPLYGRKPVLDAIDRFERSLDPQAGGLCQIVGGAGRGKTALCSTLAGDPTKPGQQNPIFLFRKNEGRTSIELMPRQLCDMLRQRFHVSVNTGDGGIARNSQAPDAELSELLTHIGAQLSRSGDRLRIIVDGIDEADDPAQAIAVLRLPPPPGVLLILGRRPDPAGRIVLPSPSGKCQRLDIHLNEAQWKNEAAVTEYFAATLPPAMRGSAAELAVAARGIFQIAVFFQKCLTRQDAPLSVADILAGSVNAADIDEEHFLTSWYEDSWNRIFFAKGPNHSQYGIACELSLLLVAGRTWMPESLIRQLLGLDPAQLKLVRMLLNWLVDRRQTKVDGRPVWWLGFDHETVRAYLTSTAADGPLSALRIEDTHAKIARHYLQQVDAASGNWHTIDTYGRAHVVWHLLQAGTPDSLKTAARLLTDLNYLSATLGNVPPRVATAH